MIVLEKVVLRPSLFPLQTGVRKVLRGRTVARAPGLAHHEIFGAVAAWRPPPRIWARSQKGAPLLARLPQRISRQNTTEDSTIAAEPYTLAAA